MRYYSPLRYPGGKGALGPFLDDLIHLNDLQGCKYFEPYAGGAGAALNLLRAGAVSEITLNDADIRIYAFWNSIINELDRFIEKVQNIQLDMPEWYRQKEICSNPLQHDLFNVGFSTFYMNRCNRSGVLSGGPIGGPKQDGQWRIDVRFSRENLIERLIDFGKKRDRIHVTNMDAIDFLKSHLPRGAARNNVLVYLDPPYVKKSDRLYMNTYKKLNHAELSRYMLNQKTLPWIMSYDNNQLIWDLYNNKCDIYYLPIRYSLNKKCQTQELLISPRYVSLPASCRSRSNRAAIDLEIDGGAYGYR